ncbi:MULTISPECIES: HpcH/HpaI aldolase family protein [Cohaesibacter]|uniref:HpcH/HpaI aldolase family protein n=1 Tax=Cohaesibacter TaxID=655352 RepID=UPI000DE8D14C|nr:MULTISPECIES: aldolase/citrate lyase family protein [Cohaesibacter]TLP48600.1 2,4-dihydroxyhept-2-ene-1,7-dioic acid aldolase [Cohaesibacter sp. CAU 1516]
MTDNHTLMRRAVDAAVNKDEPLYFGWCVLASRQAAEILAQGGFPAVLVDMQHGAIGFSDAQEMTGAIAHCGTAPIVRIPVGDFATASRALDFGAQAIVAPMINTKEQAEALVKAVKYTPLGERSYGPFQACRTYGFSNLFDYVVDGNDSCFALAMIETREALDNLEDILATDGIDGVFVGPADLSLTLLEGKAVDFDHEVTVTALKRVIAAAKAHGKLCGIYATNAHYAKLFASYGFQLIAVGSEAGFLAQGIEQTMADLASD